MRLPLITIIFLYIFSILIDWGIWSDIRRFSQKKIWSRVYLCSAVACWLLLTVTILLPKRDGNSDILPVMWLLNIYLSVYVGKLVYTLFSLIGRIPTLFKKPRLNSGLWVGLSLGLLSIIFFWYGVFVGRYEIDVKRVDVVSSRIPESFNGYTIAQFSDAHVGTWGKDTTFISNLVDSINSLHPDLIVFTGDIVNRQTSELEPFLKVFTRLKAKDGVMSVLGNHDYGDYITWKSPGERDANNVLMAAWQKQIGWNLMNNTHRFLVSEKGDSIVLIGVENWGEPPFHQYGKLFDAYPSSSDSIRNLNDSRFKILLSHNPEHWNREVTKISNIDLTLSGHTHAMQMMIDLPFLKWSPAKYRYDQWAGFYDRKAPDGTPQQVYVNVGCGEVALPMRLGATPEITLFTLRHEASSKH